MRMQVVDHECVDGFALCMSLRQMRMIRCQIIMGVRNNIRIVHGPDTIRDNRADQRQCSSHGKRSAHAAYRTYLARQ